MAINSKIVEKITTKVGKDTQFKNELLDLLHKVEEGKQPKRIIQTILEKKQ